MNTVGEENCSILKVINNYFRFIPLNGRMKMKVSRIFTSVFMCFLMVVLTIQITGCEEQDMKKTVIVKQADGQLSLAVVIKAKEGQEETVKNACIGLLEPTRKEKGCINYTLHMDPNDKGRFMF